MFRRFFAFRVYKLLIRSFLSLRVHNIEYFISQVLYFQTYFLNMAEQFSGQPLLRHDGSTVDGGDALKGKVLYSFY